MDVQFAGGDDGDDEVQNPQEKRNRHAKYLSNTGQPRGTTSTFWQKCMI